MLTNHGTLSTVTGKGSDRFLRIDVVNAKGAKVNIQDAGTFMDSGNVFTNKGKLTVSHGGELNVVGGSTFAQAGESVSGTVVIGNLGGLADSSGTGGTFLMSCVQTALSGKIPATQTVTVQGSVCGDPMLIVPGPTARARSTA